MKDTEHEAIEDTAREKAIEDKINIVVEALLETQKNPEFQLSPKTEKKLREIL